MAYDANKLTKLSALKTLATRIQTEITELDARTIQGVQVNGTALEIADKIVNILIATGSANGTIAANGVNVAVKGLAALAYKSKVSASDLETALQTAINNVGTLVGTDTGKSARAIAAEELAAQLIPETASESLDTLSEIAAWIQAHPGDAAAMNSAITKLQAIVDGIGDTGDAYTTVIAAIDAKIAAGATKVEKSSTNGNIKINGTETTVYAHPTSSGNKHIPAGGSSGQILRWSADGTAAWGNDNNTTYSAMTGATSSAAGKTGLVPAPAAGNQAKYLRGDGTWATPTNTTYSPATTSANGLMSSTDKAKLDGMEIATDSEVTEMLDEVFPTV